MKSFSTGTAITSFELAEGVGLLAGETDVDTVGVTCIFATSAKDNSVRIILSPFCNPAEAKVSSSLALYTLGGYPIFTFKKKKG